MSDELHKEEPPHREPSSGECWKYSNGFYLNLVDGLVSESFFGGQPKADDCTEQYTKRCTINIFETQIYKFIVQTHIYETQI